MTDHSRRRFLKHASWGAAAAGAAVVVPSLAGQASAAEPQSDAPAHDSPFVVWVKNPVAGEIAVLVDDRELTLTDRRLAKQLVQAAAQAQR